MQKLWKGNTNLIYLKKKNKQKKKQKKKTTTKKQTNKKLQVTIVVYTKMAGAHNLSRDS